MTEIPTSASVEVPVLPLQQPVVLPSYAREGDAGADLVAAEHAVIAPGGGRCMIGTGLSVALPVGHVGLVVPRSGLASKYGVTCLNTPGVVDSGYRGEIKVLLVNTDPIAPYEVRIGDRIAQLVIVPFVTADFVVVESLEATERGDGGFGHSGR